MTGTDTICNVSSNTTAENSFEYGRGKGVRVVFRIQYIGRIPSTVILARDGSRKPGVVFTVVGESRNTATGGASRTAAGALPCVADADTVGDEAGCGTKRNLRTILVLDYSSRMLTLEPRAKPGEGGTDEDLTPLVEPCGTNRIESASGLPRWAWPGFVPLEPRPLDVSTITGRKRAFKVAFGPVDDQLPAEALLGPSLTSRTLDIGSHQAVVRFVRVRRPKR